MSSLSLFDCSGPHSAKRIYARSFSIGLAMCAAMAIWPGERAAAADWPLRGSLAPQTTYARWDGWQFGVLAGYGNMNTDFGNSTSSLVGFILRNSTLEAEGAPSTWTALPSNTTNGAVFGGFIGYNMQWDQLVLGLDLAYKHPSIMRFGCESFSDAHLQHVGQHRAHRNNQCSTFVQARRLCGSARARRLCLGPIPAVCGGGSRRRTLQLSYKRDGN